MGNTGQDAVGHGIQVTEGGGGGRFWSRMWRGGGGEWWCLHTSKMLVVPRLFSTPIRNLPCNLNQLLDLRSTKELS